MTLMGTSSGAPGHDGSVEHAEHHSPGDELHRYDRVAEKAAAHVIAAYSTSFSAATALLPAGMRNDIRNLYAMVRVADEIVDGTALAAGFASDEVITHLDDYERAALGAANTRFHTDLVLQAWGKTMRRCHIDAEHVRAFFHSMRMDALHAHSRAQGPDPLAGAAEPRVFTRDEHDAYVYGSAEVIGLMCLAIFTRGHHRELPAVAVAGARALGAAFQRVNFLRDFAHDAEALGRIYFSVVGERGLTNEVKAELLRHINREFDVAAEAIQYLPLRPAIAVRAALEIYRDLGRQLERVDVSTLVMPNAERVRVPDARKLRIVSRAVAAELAARAR